MNRPIRVFVALFLCALLCTWAYSDPVNTRSLIGQEDINLSQADNASQQTFSRRTSTGGTTTITKLEGNAIPWDNSYSRTIRPGAIAGNGGRITGMIFGAVGATDNVVANDVTAVTVTVSGTATFNGSIVGDNTTNISGIDNVSLLGNVVGDNTGRVSAFAFGAADYTDNVVADAVHAKSLRVTTPTVPATKTTAGTTGQIAWDNNYLYWCYSDNTWRRVAYDNTW